MRKRKKLQKFQKKKKTSEVSEKEKNFRSFRKRKKHKKNRPEKTISTVRETIAPLGIMGDQLRTPLKPLNTIVLRWSEGLHGCPQLGPHDAERRQSLVIQEYNLYRSYTSI